MTGPRVPWPENLRRVVIVAFRVPEASGGAVVVESYVRMFESIGLDVEVFSIYPGTRSTFFQPRVVLRREALQRRPVIGERRGWDRLRRLPLAVAKRVDRYRALRSFRRRMMRYSTETMVLFTDVLPYSLLLEAGIRWPRQRPLLIGQHHTAFRAFDEHPEFKAIFARDFAGLDGFTALSTADAPRYEALIGVPCFAIPNPVSLPPEPEGDVDERPPRRQLAVALARYSPEKQLDLMVRSFLAATGEERLSHWELEVHGWGSERRSLQELVTRSGESHRVRLMGPVDDVRPVLREAACLLLSSRYEGFPLSVLEAAQCAVPTIGFACSSGAAELLDRVAAIVVEPAGDEAAFTAALRRALLDPQSLEERGRRARSGAGRYSHEEVLRIWAGVACALLSTRESTQATPGHGS